jgi:hypothetical protein
MPTSFVAAWRATGRPMARVLAVVFVATQQVDFVVHRRVKLLPVVGTKDHTRGSATAAFMETVEEGEVMTAATVVSVGSTGSWTTMPATTTLGSALFHHGQGLMFVYHNSRGRDKK